MDFAAFASNHPALLAIIVITRSETKRSAAKPAISLLLLMYLDSFLLIEETSPTKHLF